MALPSKFKLEELNENIFTHRTIYDMNYKQRSEDILQFAELKVIETFCKYSMMFNEGKVRRLKAGVIYKDKFNEYLMDYNQNSNNIDMFVKLDSKWAYKDFICLNSFISNLEESITLEEM